MKVYTSLISETVGVMFYLLIVLSSDGIGEELQCRLERAQRGPHGGRERALAYFSGLSVGSGMGIGGCDIDGSDVNEPLGKQDMSYLLKDSQPLTCFCCHTIYTASPVPFLVS
eukprot:g32053.t1